MILTDKAKKDFLRYYGTSTEYFTITLKEIEQHANIIEWLDSVGIYVDVASNSQTMTFDAYVDDDYICFYHSRKEATKQAIIKANEIYNKR